MNVRSNRARVARVAMLGMLATAVAVGCTPADGGVPMGGRPAEGGTCDPNGIKELQPEVCQ